MQVLPLAKKFLENEAILDTYWVYDNEFVKGLIILKKTELLNYMLIHFLKD